MSLVAGTRLGPYEIQSAIGAGGMGEVYKARDTRLDRDVAIKVLPDDIAGDADRLRRFEEEARAVAALNHPNILTVHDVGAQDGTSFVVTELLEGETLREVLCRRLPTQRQLLSVAVQAADGIAAAHRKGIVHRDLKPENLFVTTDGRVKILDFGLAKRTGTRDGVDATTEGVTEPGVLMGTVAYMSPEQARGEAVGLASDVFSFGVVLYELLTRRHPFRRETVAATLSAILHETPSRPSNVEGVIPPALDGVVRRCLEKDQTERFATGHDLAVALEAVLQAPSGAVSLQEVEERSPYPGLRSFSEKDARVFFGREAEVTALWDRIGARRLLAVIGPSGAGKTSFLRAGVIPARPDEWTAIACTPGPAPLRGLGQALGPALAADHEALSQLAGFEDPDTAFTLVSRWRAAHGDALLVVDQFEEVYTLNPPEMQARFATLLARLASEADVHVVLSLRDDFLMRCHDHPCLAALFDGLTPLGALTHEGLCRALMEPAARLGYRFEDAALVEDMVACVEGARAALPLLAFAVSRLWEQRDRERKVLTRAAYENIGGVAGALAQHAEATLDRIGSARQALVREVFRNLVTAQGTRAVVDRDELLSAFSDRTAAEAVLGELVDARLLTSYEVEGREGEPNRHRIEIVHESLLKAWPRLVRWQTQDEDGAHLRDQLKQAARLWTEKGRSADLLWTGTAYREYALWRERYAAPLTAVENAFAAAMAARAKRTKRVRTAAVGALVVGLSAVAIVIGISRQTAVESGRRAEASKLVALGRVELDRDPTATVAYARKSLEMSDTAEARLLALEALWRGPTALILPLQGMDSVRVAFDGNGSRLALTGFTPDIVVVGSDGRIAGRFKVEPTQANPRDAVFVDEGRHLLTWLSGDDRVRLLDLGGREVRSFPGAADSVRLVGDDSFAALAPMNSGASDRVVRWPLQGGGPSVLDTWARPAGVGRRAVDLDPGLRWLAYASGNGVFVHPLGKPGPDRLLGRHAGRVRQVRFDPSGTHLLSGDEHGTLRLWSMPGGEALWMRAGPPIARFSRFSFDSTGRQLVWGTVEGTALLELDGPPDASPLLLRRPDVLYAGQCAFSADGLWLASASTESLSVWPRTMPYARVLSRHTEGPIESLAFSSESRYLVSCARDGARVWPLAVGMGAGRRIDIGDGKEYMCYGAAISPDGSQVAVASPFNGLFLAPIDGGPARRLIDFAGRNVTIGPVAFDATGKKLALAAGYAATSERLEMYVVDRPSGAVQTVPLRKEPSQGPYQGGVRAVAFSPDGNLLTAGDGGIRRWNLPAGTNEVVAGGPGSQAKLAADRIGHWVVVALGRGGAADDSMDMHLSLLDLGTGEQRPVQTHGNRLHSIATDPGGKWVVSGDRTGVTRVGSTSGKEPHVLPGHSGPVYSAAVSPDGKWIASASGREIRVWPMPDLSKPPLHTLPHDVLIAKLESLTNLRAVRDTASSTGWKIEVGPFPGWKNVPTW